MKLYAGTSEQFRADKQWLLDNHSLLFEGRCGRPHRRERRSCAIMKVRIVQNIAAAALGVANPRREHRLSSPASRPPAHDPGSPNAVSTELRLRNVSFDVDDLNASLEGLAADGYGLVVGVGRNAGIWRQAYVRGPEGIIVSLAQRIG